MKQEHVESRTKQPSIPGNVIVAAIVILLAFSVAPFYFKGDPLAETFFNLVIAVVTTIVSVYATYFYARSTGKDELTRYGLQAWRNLDSLGIKVSQQVGAEDSNNSMLEGWLLDIDQAKWAWRDLLRGVFELQGRLQAETDEIASNYKARLAEAKTPESRLELQSKQAAEIAQVVSRAPLPMKLPEEVACPNCSTTLTARLGSSANDTAWPLCPNCNTRFPVHRQADGSVKLGHSALHTTVKIECPKCARSLSFVIPKEGETSFVSKCVGCCTHLHFRGTCQQPTLTDLGISNARFTCPHCKQEGPCWISPGRSVSFEEECQGCHRRVRISGTKDVFTVTAQSDAPPA
jgi:hypothetical protein